MKTRIWLFDIISRDKLGGLILQAQWDCYSAYKCREFNSAPLMLEYDAVVWRTPMPVVQDVERNRQLEVFLANDSKLFVFLVEPYATGNNGSTISVVEALLHGQDSKFMSRMHVHKTGRNLVLTPDGQLSPFREYLEHKSSQWHVAFELGDWLRLWHVTRKEMRLLLLSLSTRIAPIFSLRQQTMNRARFF
jgi:hypothetical protein